MDYPERGRGYCRQMNGANEAHMTPDSAAYFHEQDGKIVEKKHGHAWATKKLRTAWPGAVAEDCSDLTNTNLDKQAPGRFNLPRGADFRTIRSQNEKDNKISPLSLHSSFR
jgi:hypothetical protein